MSAALGSESKDFYRFMAVLQAQAAEPIPAPGGCGASVERRGGNIGKTPVPGTMCNGG